MRYNSESPEIKVSISANVLLFKDIKITLGLFITTRKMHPLFRENSYLEVSTTIHIIELEFLLPNPKLKAKLSS